MYKTCFELRCRIGTVSCQFSEKELFNKVHHIPLIKEFPHIHGIISAVVNMERDKIHYSQGPGIEKQCSVKRKHYF